MSTVFQELVLPNGIRLKNRIAKAAMEENMAASGQMPGKALFNLYQAWAGGGAGLIITGNVMVDRRSMTGPGGVVLEAGVEPAPFREWARIAKSGGAAIWMQISHPGRQMMANMGGLAVGPSPIPLNMGKHSHRFVQPKALSEADIQELINRFWTTALLAQEAGFDGVEVHAAHGYLLSQFLSPLSNQRRDRWGGSLENRARFLLETVKAIREQVAPEFCVSVKLNSADFQRGGFDADDARQVVTWLNDLSVDLVELSGGSYESPAMQGRTANGRTLAREAYFLEFAKDMTQTARMPLMTTGGIRRIPVAESVLEGGIAVAGIATAMAYVPDLPGRWRTDPAFVVEPPPIGFKDKALNSLGTMAMTRYQLQRMGSGHQPTFTARPWRVLLRDQLRLAWLARRYRKTVSSRLIVE